MAVIFVIEDNDQIREAVASYLRLDEHETVEFGRLHGVRDAVRMRSPDLIILDIMLPDGNGFQFARQLRADHDVPILFLTARSSESDRITGFEVGGDDYVIKPFSPREVALRVRSILRRSGAGRHAESEPYSWFLDDEVLLLDRQAHRAVLNNRELHLTAAEWEILALLAHHPGMVFTRDRILGATLSYLAEGSERTVDTHIKNIRSKLGNPGWIETVRSYGYRFAGRPSGKPS
jgi:DNA-binding response OmpR family regulator